MTEPLPNRQIAEEAADWAVRIDAGPLDLDDRRRLAGWLRASPLHVDELLQSASLLAGIGRLAGSVSRSVEGILAEAAPEVVPLFASRRATGPVRSSAQPRTLPRRPRLAWAAALALVVVASLALVRGDVPSAVGDGTAQGIYATAIGEQRSIALADGSIMYMNAASRVRVAMADGVRRIDLLEGEALFDVAHDPARPFRVHAGDTVAQAVGTKFNVKYIADGVRVVVVEGKVMVGERPAPVPRRARPTPPGTGEAVEAAAPLVLIAGQQATLGARLAPAASPVNVAAATSWRMRQLSFDREGLDEIAAEFNRYNRTKLVVVGNGLAGTRFSGVFGANDPESFVAFLELSAGIRVDRSQPGRIVLSAR